MKNSNPRSSFSAKSKKAPAATNVTRTPAPPTKPRNLDVRKREYLTPDEVKNLRDAAKALARNGLRDWLLITMMYRHGLRVSEAINLHWDQVNFKGAKLHVNRLKNGDPSIHYLQADELRSLRKLLRDEPDAQFVFCSERGTPLAARTAHGIIARAGVEAGIRFPVHPHMLRHSRGYRLAATGEDTRAIQAYLGHRNIQHTVLYTKLDPRRFKGFGRD